eukprot:SAG11_NODE_37972_length_254_cov_0.987097_1_plen_49_part_10
MRLQVSPHVINFYMSSYGIVSGTLTLLARDYHTIQVRVAQQHISISSVP